MWKKILIIISILGIVVCIYVVPTNFNHQNISSSSIKSHVNLSNIYIKEMKEENIEDFLYIYQHKDVKKYHSFHDNHIPSSNLKFYYLNHIGKLPFKYLHIHGIFEKNHKTMLGYVYSYHRSSDPHSLYIVYSIRPDIWSKGICTKAVYIYLNQYMKEMQKNNIHQIKATVLTHNPASKRVLEKNGFHVFKMDYHHKSVCYFMIFSLKKDMNKK